ncbi:hypothetical protein PAL_GLEAN10001948 [Pteropus alecto]|uniref:Uncharacterized protein n=1 Tax=Pteropus alecto TaxID=9402 RepID=L5KJ41_PTEAL|nr:hypothetical protein PAL_GLEAN10001948 [Pteropus alecto]
MASQCHIKAEVTAKTEKKRNMKIPFHIPEYEYSAKRRKMTMVHYKRQNKRLPKQGAAPADTAAQKGRHYRHGTGLARSTDFEGGARTSKAEHGLRRRSTGRECAGPSARQRPPPQPCGSGAAPSNGS